MRRVVHIFAEKEHHIADHATKVLGKNGLRSLFVGNGHTNVIHRILLPHSRLIGAVRGRECVGGAMEHIVVRLQRVLVVLELRWQVLVHR